MLQKSIIVTIILQTHFVICFAIGNPIVTTPLGIIEGYWTKTVNNRTYAAFDGIPYAVPPVGKYRFEEPQPIKPWVGVWKAKVEYKCIQYNHYTEPNEDFVIGDEDCLYINVYTPGMNKTKIYDVIVYIHGGAFMFGSGAMYGHKYILDRDVIYVSLNYRLGPLGFLSTEDTVLPGNNGLKDQLLALKWIKENIRYFGGNPESITLTGMSAGGASAHIHYISPLSQGLFHRGIIQSGTALNNWVLVENSFEKAKRLGSLVGCEFQNSTAFIDCLKTRSARQIVDTVQHFLGWLYNPFSPFGVVIDKISRNAILPEHPLELIKKNRFENLPLIFSCVESEGLYPAADFLREPELLDQLNQHWEKLIPYVLDFNYTILPNNQHEVSRKIRNFYFQNKDINKESFPTLIKVVTDRLGAHSKSEARSKTNENFGASHGDDTVYVLSSNVNVRSTSLDIQMSDILLNMWSYYARTSQPKFSGFEEWKPVEKDMGLHLRYMHIINPKNIKVKTTESLGNRKFWNSLDFLENENLLK
ncbi:Carboxylesterase family [Popillia japonica]|uniref:Carboxylic ester hydrolase n=1 Tax=Popillia japonica TaxID=7064 RepID=A0AAW1MGB5_POPJA